nr:hypothetical protein [uncultured Desulfobacter sp.]
MTEKSRSASILSLLLVFCLAPCAFAHSLIVGVYSNDDDTITVEGKYDTGATAQGAQVRLESLGSGKVLFKQRLGLESELTVKMPEEPYRIVLDGGPGHVAIKEGIAPPKGFSVKPKSGQQKTQTARRHGTPNLSPAYFVTLGLVFCFLFLTLFICRQNTNKIIKTIQNNR